MGKTIKKMKGSVIVTASGESHAKHFNDAEIHRRAKSDPEAQPLTAQQLAKFKRVNPFAGSKKTYG